MKIGDWNGGSEQKKRRGTESVWFYEVNEAETAVCSCTFGTINL